MNLPDNSNQYLLIFRGTDWDRGLSPEQIQGVLTKWGAWFEGLKADGKLLGGQPLQAEGRVVTGKSGRNVADGPYAESKEAVGGYFLLKVESLDEATEIAQQCPALEHGIIVEVRPVAAQCGMKDRLEQIGAGELATAGV
jgi:hypothetical protein